MPGPLSRMKAWRSSRSFDSPITSSGNDMSASDEKTARDMTVVTWTVQPSGLPDQGSLPAIPPSPIPAQKPVSYNVLKFEHGAIWGLCFYLPFLIVPWVMTAILAFRPLRRATYYDETFTLTAQDVAEIELSNRVARVLGAIGAVVALPITSGLLAQAAVVYTQDSGKGRRDFKLPQTIALADRAWSNLLFWTEGLRKRPFVREKLHGYSIGGLGPRSVSLSRFLVASAALMILVSIQQPLQQVLVSFEVITIPTCSDGYDNTCEGGFNVVERLGLDPDTIQFQIATADGYADYLSDKLASLGFGDQLPYLWNENGVQTSNYTDSFTQASVAPLWRDGILNTTPDHPALYVTPFPNGTTTGVLSDFSVRLNTSITCRHVDQSNFPSPCPGGLPLTASLGVDNLETTGHSTAVDICVPGNYTASPWDHSLLVQDISEELWIQTFQNDSHNVTRCIANSTKGYLRLPNYYSKNQPSDLLQSAEGDIGDYLDFDQTHNLPEICRGPGVCYMPAGPLTISALAFFGNDTWFDIASRTIQASNRTRSDPSSSFNRWLQKPFPLGRLGAEENNWLQLPYTIDGSSDDKLLASVNGTVATWLQRYVVDPDPLTKMLFLSTIFANQALLVETGNRLGGRPVFYSPRTMISKPSISLPAIIILSVLVGLQTIALIGLTVYASRKPVWTSDLDALAMIRLGSKLHTEQLPAPRPSVKGHTQGFDSLSGLVRFEVPSEGCQIQPTLGIGLALREILDGDLPLEDNP